ncbi:MAG: membrane protein insertase YidC [Alphaproteobacteria bacterium]|nr:membrane protein insertase YidC [Alphaproteobacteria bacterium]
MFDKNNHNNPNNKNAMHPEDMRNMFIFFAIAAVLYFAYNFYVIGPQKEAMLIAQKKQAEIAANPQSPEAVKLAQIKNPIERDEAIKSEQRIQIDNGSVHGSITTKGARLDDIELSHYHTTLGGSEDVAVLSPAKTKFPRHVEYGWASSDDQIKLPNKDTIWQVSGNADLTKDTPVTLTWSNGQGLTFERTFSLDDKYLFTITQNVSNQSGKSVTLYPYGLVSQQGKPPNFAGTWISHEGPLGYVGDEMKEPSYNSLRKDTKEASSANQGWIGITDKYWLTALIPPQGQDVKYSFSYAGTRKDPDNIGRFQSDFLGAPMTLTAGTSSAVQSRLFVGAKEYATLQDYEKNADIPKFNLAVNFGMLWFMSKPFFYILHHAGEIFGNFGAAIIFLTILIRGAVFPLTNLSYKSFAGMKKVNPQIVELRKELKDDKQKLQAELIKLYQKEGVNPMSGCLPILLQIPIFFALYRVLFVTIEMRHAPFVGWIKDLSAPDPTSIFNLFGLIPWDPPAVLMIGVWPCLMLVAMVMQKNLNPPPQDKLQKDMATFMPFFFAFIMAKFAAGLVIYWTFSALIGVLQQIIIMKRMNVPIHLFGETKEEEELDDQIDDGPAVHPLAQMAEDEFEDALGLDDGDGQPTKPIKPPKPKTKPKKSKKKK